MDGDGVRRNQSLGRLDRLSKRQAEMLRARKQAEFEAKPSRRDSADLALGAFLDR